MRHLVSVKPTLSHINLLHPASTISHHAPNFLKTSSYISHQAWQFVIYLATTDHILRVLQSWTAAENAERNVKCGMRNAKECEMLTPSLPHPVKFLGWKMHGWACKQCIFQSYNNYFQCYAFWWKPFPMQVWKGRQKGFKGLKCHTFMGRFQMTSWQWRG